MMPSFSFPKVRHAEDPRVEAAAAGHGLQVHLEPDTEKLGIRRQSRRDYFRNLLKKTPLFSDSKALTATNRSLRPPESLQAFFSTPSLSMRSPEFPISPMDKPLPPTPAPGAEEDEAPSPAISLTKYPLKLGRIISPLALPDLHILFSGAPQFFARADGYHHHHYHNHTGIPQPSIAFPWDSDLRWRDLRDHITIHDDAWHAVSTWSHLPVPVLSNPDATRLVEQQHSLHFVPRCQERPNMLSMQGLERGTMGYQAALEMAVSDALDLPKEISPKIIAQQRINFLNGKDGLRSISDTMLVDRLIAVSEVYHKNPLKHYRSSVQLYTEIYQILFPPSKVIDPHDPYSLEVQIDSLIEVLAAPMVWIDFSQVEWRVRLGQILWESPPTSSSATQDAEDARVTCLNGNAVIDCGTERYWLLLQVLLGCELLMRLDATVAHRHANIEVPKLPEIRRFEKDAPNSVKWSLILARVWLENICMEWPGVDENVEKKSTGWLANWTGRAGTATKTKDFLLANLRFSGRHELRQLSGLLNFARSIHWPNMEALETKVSTNGIHVSHSVVDSAVNTATSGSTPKSSYFSIGLPRMRQGQSHQQQLKQSSLPTNFPALSHPPGWLSNSYVSGLVLPGEGLSHLLMSTLLENDADALSRLGDQANFYGGFLYLQRTFWSTACIVGRVLAAKEGTTECMGWVSSDVVPTGISEGWFDIDVTAVPDRFLSRTGKPRIMYNNEIEIDGHVIGGGDPSSVLPGDFTIPTDESTQTRLDIRFESLDLFSAADSVYSDTPTEERSFSLSHEMDSRIEMYFAVMRFTMASTSPEEMLNINLLHDVHFVTAHPCMAPPSTDIVMPLANPYFQPPPSDSPLIPTTPSGHPLHKAFTYSKIHLSKILTIPPTTPLSLILSRPASPDPTQSTLHTTSSSILKVLVIDCMEKMQHSKAAAVELDEIGNDKEILARAVCAERGWNALISRRGKVCLACSVREAAALGWRVIIRVA